MSQRRVFARRLEFEHALPPPEASVGQAREVTAEDVQWFARRRNARHARRFRGGMPPGRVPPRGSETRGKRTHVSTLFLSRTHLGALGGGSLNDVQHGGGVPGRVCGHGVGVLVVICVFALKGDVGSAHRSREEK